MKRQKKTFYPSLRFPEFTEEWKYLPLTQLAKKINDSYNPRTSEESYPCIELESISQGDGLILKTFDSKNSSSIKTKFKPKDILFGKLRPYLRKYAFVNFEGVCSSEIWVIRATSIIKKYLFYLIQTSRFQRYANIQSGSKMPRSNWEIVSQAKYAIPPTSSEQEKISSFLSSVDTKINQLINQHELMKKYKAGLIQKIFSREIRFKDEKNNHFPNWKALPLGELYQFKTTNSFSRDKLNYNEGKARNIHYGDIHKNFKSRLFLSQENVPFINPDISLQKIAKENYCKEGDLVIADASEDYADIGKCIEIIDLNEEKVLAGLHTLLARLSSNDIHIGYGSYFMSSPDVRKQIKRISQGTKVLSISTGRMEDIIVPLPSLPEQIKIVNFLSSIESKIDKIDLEIENTKFFKKSLLQHMTI